MGLDEAKGYIFLSWTEPEMFTGLSGGNLLCFGCFGKFDCLGCFDGFDCRAKARPTLP